MPQGWRTTLLGGLLGAALLAAPLAALGAEEPTATDEGRRMDRRVEIINGTGVVMTAFYATNIGVDGWGKDHLRNRVLDPNKRVTLNFEDGSGACWFDFKAVFADGDVVVRRKFNVCKETGWRVFERKPVEEVGQRV